MKSIKADFNFEHFEEMLGAVRSDRELSLPTHMNHDGSWGMEASITQLLLTWARVHEFPRLSTYISDSKPAFRDEHLAELGKRMHGVAALYLATRVVSREGTKIPDEEFWAHCYPTLDAIRRCDIYSGDQVSKTYPRRFSSIAAQFMCLHGTPYEFPRSLYDTPIRKDSLSRSQFRSLLLSVVGGSPFLTEFFERHESQLQSLATILYELFQNTNDHAYDDLKGQSFERNVRGFVVKDHSGDLNDGTLDAMRSQNSFFNKYLSFCGSLFRKKGRKRYEFLEISVVDGGLGLAQQFSRTPLSQISEEHEGRVTVDCFKQGVSSKGPSSRGEGLYEVWNALRELRGFIRLRTGRVCLFQTFEKGLATPTAFKNWSSSKSLNHASGTSVTIIIPCVD
jgi:hypothetical protein